MLRTGDILFIETRNTEFFYTGGILQPRQFVLPRDYDLTVVEVISLADGIWEKPHDENFIKGVNVEQTRAALKAAGVTDAHVPIPFTVIAVNAGGRLVLGTRWAE